MRETKSKQSYFINRKWTKYITVSQVNDAPKRKMSFTHRNCVFFFNNKVSIKCRRELAQNSTVNDPFRPFCLLLFFPSAIIPDLFRLSERSTFTTLEQSVFYFLFLTIYRTSETVIFCNAIASLIRSMNATKRLASFTENINMATIAIFRIVMQKV